ncbi:hypothetical protein B0H65DRAFT_470310 [Neurospora tetraspora]|uniref:Uncharacterized protein n=1 Tax=Neurospora tetraspora TaxID=94610 RepID=A0AAE0JDA7_9PEZI|nr:hypothetical protein B0H65DRAFT_470310 [Neurospora tetraspora]
MAIRDFLVVVACLRVLGPHDMDGSEIPGMDGAVGVQISTADARSTSSLVQSCPEHENLVLCCLLTVFGVTRGTEFLVLTVLDASVQNISGAPECENNDQGG